MRLLCFKCSNPDPHVKQQLWELIRMGDQGYYSDHIIYSLFYIHESRASFALLIDSGLERVPKFDYII